MYFIALSGFSHNVTRASLFSECGVHYDYNFAELHPYDISAKNQYIDEISLANT